MENTKQQLVIDDLNYCDTVCDDTEAIVGGGKFWNAVKGAVQDKWGAIKTTTKDLFTQGTLPTGQTANDLIEPLPWSIFRRLF